MYDLDGGIQGYNVFLYCANNPTNRIDSSGADSGKVDDLDLIDGELCERGGSGDGFSGGRAPTPNSGGLRNLLKNLTGQSGAGQHAHHIFPQKFARDFRKLGINNHNAIYGAWWDAFFKMPDVTADDAFSLVGYLADLFGFILNF